MNKQIYHFLVFLTFGLCGWIGCVLFLHDGADWLKIENPSISSLIFHENSIRVFVISLIWGGFCSFPFLWMHTKKLQWIGTLLFLPLSMFMIPTAYISLWPSNSFSFSSFEQVKIIVAQGWLTFTNVYLLCIFLPFSIWSYYHRNNDEVS